MEKNIYEAIDSVLAQTYKHWSDLWDNQSIDSSSLIVKEYKDQRIHYFYSEKFQPREARNRAIEKQVEFVWFS